MLTPFTDYGDALAAYFTATSADERKHADRECKRLRALTPEFKGVTYWWDQQPRTSKRGKRKAA